MISARLFASARSRPSRVLTLAIACAAAPVLASCSAKPAALVRSAAAKPLHHRQAKTQPALGPLPIPAPPRQLGLDVEFYVRPAELIVLKALQIVRYVKALNANALSISFPFYTTGDGGTEIMAGASTPSPAQVATFVEIANRSGLYVVLRPLLDEANLRTWRSAFAPRSVTAWFASYRRFLRPYLLAARASGVNDFSVGVELGPALTRHYWDSFDSWARHIYHGVLSFSADGHYFIKGQLGGGTVTSHQVDAYPGFKVSDKVSATTLASLWNRWIARFPIDANPRVTVFSEVGIAAEPGAYRNSAWWGNAIGPVIPSIQTRWYDAACQAVADNHIAGIYFWAISFDRALDKPANLSDPGSFVAEPSARAIKRCFTHLRD